MNLFPVPWRKSLESKTLSGTHPFRQFAGALECRKLREKEIDPIEAREAAKREAALERAKSPKFKDAAAAYMAAHRVAWKNDKHAAQWPATLTKYAYPIIGDLPLQFIDTTVVMQVIEPIWSEKPETANRLRGRIETVLDWATVRGYRQGENPARWRGHLDKLLPARSKVRKTRHHSALPYAELPDFMIKLRAQDGVAARALEFTILTAARTSEIIGAKRNEIDTKDKVWIVPAERMNAGKEHRVPLSDRALEILESIGSEGDDKNPFVFPGRGPRRAAQQYGDAETAAAHGSRGSHRAWLPIDVSGLGGGKDKLRE
jgi:integrase